MRLNKQHRLVNWVDGMKINQSHFQAMENSLLESIHLNTAGLLPSYAFGLLPASRLNVEPFGMEVTAEKIEIYKCLAITQDGIVIQVENGNSAGLKSSIQELLKGQQLAKAQSWYVMLSIKPYDRRPEGEADPEEAAFRPPYAVPSYSIALVPEDMLQGNQQLAAKLPLARIVISREQGNRIDESYIPPATSIKSVPALYSKFKDFEKQLSEIDFFLIEIIKKARDKQRQNQSTSISNDLLEISSHLSQFISGNLDTYIHLLEHQPPLHLQLWIIRMARAMQSSFRYLIDKDNTFNYCEKYSTYEASFLEAGVKQILSLEYNHLNFRPSLNTMDHWLSSLRNLLQTLSELHYNELGKPGIIDAPRTPQGNSMRFDIKERNATGRGSSGSNEGDDWGME